jgi:hypothetical protein
MVKANWWRPIPALALLAVAGVLSTTAGTPNELPGIALEWPLLLHLERGLARGKRIYDGRTNGRQAFDRARSTATSAYP